MEGKGERTKEVEQELKVSLLISPAGHVRMKGRGWGRKEQRRCLSEASSICQRPETSTWAGCFNNIFLKRGLSCPENKTNRDSREKAVMTAGFCFLRERGYQMSNWPA